MGVVDKEESGRIRAVLGPARTGRASNNSKIVDFNWSRWSRPTGTMRPGAAKSSATAPAAGGVGSGQAIAPPPTRSFDAPSFKTFRADINRSSTKDAIATPVPNGWSAEHWNERLEYLAGLCESLNPKLAAAHRQKARSIREALAVKGVT